MVGNLYTEKKKRILAIVGAIPCRNHIYSGIFTLNQIIELSKIGKYEIDIIFVRPMFPRLTNWIGRRIKRNFLALDRPIDPKTEGIKVHLIPYLHLPKFNMSIIILTSYLYILIRRLKFDVIHAYFLLFPGYLGVRLGYFFKKPVVVTAMGSDVNLLYGKPIYGKTFKPSVIEKIMMALEKADGIVAKSDYLKKRIKDLGISEKKILVINNGVCKKKFHIFDIGDVLLRRSKKTILYVGNLYAEKGLKELLEAIEILSRKRSDFSLVVIGNGPFEKEFSELIQRLKLEKFVRMEGQKSHEKIPRWINKSYVLCLPSHNEGFPNVVIESIACGRPVVASNIGGIPEIINDPTLGILVPPRNVEKLAEALDEALDKEWKWDIIAKSGARFHWENILPKFNELYDELI
jgi:teichuronic acid biosynthesis glycosyltransferase TuaC